MTDLFGEEKIMALSWKQPFASLMLHGKIETRTWNTGYRGLVLICASKQPYTESKIMSISGERQTQRILSFLNENHVKELFGKAIAIGRLVDCRKMRKEDEDACFVQFYPDLYCHIYEDVCAIKPFDWKGVQGWKKVEKNIIDSIEFLK